MSETAISLVSNKVPAHVKEASGLGNENVTAEHLQTPRVKLLQQMNSEVDPNHDAYIDGAKPGDFVTALPTKTIAQSYTLLTCISKKTLFFGENVRVVVG